MTQLSKKDWLFLCILILCWGMSWPIMKLGVTNCPPITFRVISFALALPVLFAVMRVQGVSLAIPKGHFLTIVKLAIPNMFLSNMLIISGVFLLPSGRAAILCYTMPIWAVISSMILLKARLTIRGFIGIVCATAGALLLISGELSAIAGSPFGIAIVLAAAASWGFGTVLMKKTLIPMPSIALTFWMIILSTIGLFICALILEFRQLTFSENGIGLLIFAIFYNGIFVSGVANVIWISLARTLPPIVSSLSIMFVPVLGVFSSSWFLGDQPSFADYCAMVLILISMASVLLVFKKKTSTPS